jgi:D-sedoheptulose 7-phosphate isomerase
VNAEQHVIDAVDSSLAVLARVKEPSIASEIEHAARVLVEAFVAGGKAIACGNGGSMCDAMHFAEELTGRFRDDRPGVAALAASDVGHMSCVANDYGYDHVFERYVLTLGRPGDVLLAISTSGTSRNVVLAASAARASGMTVIALTGVPGAPLSECSDVVVCTPGVGRADRVQEAHGLVIHILIELVERALHPGLYE